jgi:shikimate dehydrogenase
MRPDLDTKLIFLLGDPLRQSLASRVYNRWLEGAGQNMLYLPVELHSEEDVAKVLCAARVLPFAGTGRHEAL